VVSLPVAAIPPDASLLRERPVLQRFASPFNLGRQPTLSLPCGKGAPPPSLQLVARPLGEATLCRVGQAFEQATDWHHLRPPL
jgi:Asp-tRNA(Asn)/Glu-tRNA(Gln) amidotransferase A subunit family amidase